jgi:hypothetical protein
MSNTRKLKPPLGGKVTLYHCAVCGLRFHTAADRAAHWKIIPGARICQPQDVMKNILNFRHRRGAWERVTEAPRRA